MEKSDNPNRLISESSPYLLQHAYNPVDWFPWGTEALEKAKKENKTILLSIGYSACHWCHVMERESFEDPETAKLMNKYFVSIKVDREERPDIDKIYQLAHQLLTHRPGGWPLTAFLRPSDQVPIFMGTYFPPVPVGDMSSFKHLLERVNYHVKASKGKFDDKYGELKVALNTIGDIPSQATKLQDKELPAIAVDGLYEQYDPVYGGFGEPPKFPSPAPLAFLLNFVDKGGCESGSGNTAHLIALHTLEAMAAGGIYDQVGGGFCRYSVDAQWKIPHFEKMLYDNAQLMSVYARAAYLKKESGFERIAIDTGKWVMREMQSSNGGYFSTLDADSEGEEGKFYVWTVSELQNVLTKEEFTTLEIRHGLRGVPNFEGKWNLCIETGIEDVAKRSNLSTDDTVTLLESARSKLFTERGKRVRPSRDEKILTSWNGLMIGAMATTGRLLKQPKFIDSAERALEFIKHNLWQQGRLLAVAKDGDVRFNAYLDDHVFLIHGILQKLQARWNEGDLYFLIDLADCVLKHFVKVDSGALYFTSDDHEELIAKVVPASDDATPSGNGVAALVLLKLGYLLGETRYVSAAERILEAIQPAIEVIPAAFATAAMAITEKFHPSAIVVIRGESEQMVPWQMEIDCHPDLDAMVLAIPNDCKALPGVLRERQTSGSGVVGYVCRHYTCGLPCHTVEELLEQLRSSSSTAT